MWDLGQCLDFHNPTWVWKKDQAIRDMEVHGYQCMIARDCTRKDNGQTVKQFAGVPASSDLLDLVRVTPSTERVLYECIYGEQMPFKGYFDIEYYYDSTVHAVAHLELFLKGLSTGLREFFANFFAEGQVPLFGLTEATRLYLGMEDGKKYKISYHVIVNNLFFTSTGPLKAFAKWFVDREMRLLRKRKLESDYSEANAGTGLEKLLCEVSACDMVDLKVYSSFQQMRMPLSTKHKDGQSSILLGLCSRFDPFASGLGLCKFSNDVDEHKDLFLTLINESPSFVEAHTVPNDYISPLLASIDSQCRPLVRSAGPSVKKQRAGCVKKQHAECVYCPKLDQWGDVLESAISRCLKERDLSAQRVRCVQRSQRRDAFLYVEMISCQVGDGPKPCLLGQTHHKTNHQYILVSHKGVLSVECHSHRCVGQKLRIGCLAEHELGRLSRLHSHVELDKAGASETDQCKGKESDGDDDVHMEEEGSCEWTKGGSSHNEGKMDPDEEKGVDDLDDIRVLDDSVAFQTDPTREEGVGDSDAKDLVEGDSPSEGVDSDWSCHDYDETFDESGDTHIAPVDYPSKHMCVEEGTDYEIPFDEKYTSSRMRPYPIDCPCILVQAQMGVGKSVAERDFVKRLAHKYSPGGLVVVKVSFRKSFTAQEVKMLGDATNLPWISYENVAGSEIDLFDAPFVVVQWECLHKLRWTRAMEDGRRLVVLCDEWNSIMRQMESHTGLPAHDLLMFQSLLNDASHKLFMDACTNIHTIAACQAFARCDACAGCEDSACCKPYVIVNDFKAHEEKGTQVIPYEDYEFQLYRLHKTVRDGTPSVVVTHSKTIAVEIFHGLEELFPDKKVALYTGDTPQDVKAHDFRDVNVAWRDVDVVIYNSTCEAGVSCTDERFEDVFAFFSTDLITAQASLQMVGRIRPMKRLHLYVKQAIGSGEDDALPLKKEDIFEDYRSVRGE
mmetsp:Transcript_33455/g.81601  ORF Transcript_33455/g.81601 Transcript_33455/m.81601 type:complete len:952 (-) Transcript_33455:247-3102(-)